MKKIKELFGQCFGSKVYYELSSNGDGFNTVCRETRGSFTSAAIADLLAASADVEGSRTITCNFGQVKLVVRKHWWSKPTVFTAKIAA